MCDIINAELLHFLVLKCDKRVIICVTDVTKTKLSQI